MTEKKQIRLYMHRLTSRINRLQRIKASVSACAHLVASPIWHNTQNLLIFMAMESEIDTFPLIKTALEEGKNVFIPRVRNSNLLFTQIDNLEEPFEKGPFGIQQVLGPKPMWNPSTKLLSTLVVVPGMAFDSKGNRLGRGKGFYDRFIAMARHNIPYPKLQCLGYAYEQQILDNLVPQKHDQAMDGLVTDIQYRHFKRI